MTTPIAYHRGGEVANPTVVLIHRGGALHSMWGPQLPDLETRYHVVAPDLFYPGAWGDFTVAKAASDVLAVLDEAAPNKRVVLVGIALGAVVAMQLALDAPERVRGLVLGAPRVKVPGGAMWLNRALMRLMPRQMIENSHVRAARRTTNDLSEQAERDMRRVGRPGLLAASRAMEGIDFTEALPRLTAPTLVMIGAHGTETARSAATRIAGAAPNARLHLLEDTGSGLNTDHPEAFTNAVIEFVDALPPPEPVS